MKLCVESEIIFVPTLHISVCWEEDVGWSLGKNQKDRQLIIIVPVFD